MSKVNQNIDLNDTTPFITPDGNHILGQAFILRKISKFITGGTDDGIIPVACFYDLKTGKLITELIPKELRKEYENI